MVACPMCSKTFQWQAHLNDHMVSHTKEKPHKCPTCSIAFGLIVTLKRHIKTVHDGMKVIQKNNYKCPLCSFKCPSRQKLEAHSRKHSTERPFSCNIFGCDFKTKYQVALREHVRNIHNLERPHICTSTGCNYKTFLVCNLKRHLAVHSNQKPFLCKFLGCNFKFKTKLYLQEHIYRVHNDEKPFKCSKCNNFQTKYKFRLRQHEADHKSIKRFHCQVPNCSYATHFNSSLQLHFDSKHRKKDVACKEPGCKFTCGSSVLLMHQNRSQHHRFPILQCPANSC